MSSRPASQLTFRLADASEAAHLTSLINLAFRSEITGQTWLFDDQERRRDIVSIEDIKKLIQGPDTVMLVGLNAEHQDPVACCFVRKPSDPPAAHMSSGAAWLGFLAVDTTHHRSGYGAAMLHYAEGFVRDEWKATRMEIDFVNTRLQLRAWYERMGYKATGAKRDFPYTEGSREILADGLEMIVLGRDL